MLTTEKAQNLIAKVPSRLCPGAPRTPLRQVQYCFPSALSVGSPGSQCEAESQGCCHSFRREPNTAIFTKAVPTEASYGVLA